MPERVVDLLKTIHIYHHHTHRVAIAARVLNSRLQAVMGQRAIRQAGKRVVKRLMGDLAFAFGNSALHRIHRGRQGPQLILALDLDLVPIIALCDPLRGGDQPTQRSCYAMRQNEGRNQRNTQRQQRNQGQPFAKGAKRPTVLKRNLQHRADIAPAASFQRYLQRQVFGVAQSHGIRFADIGTRTQCARQRIA